MAFNESCLNISLVFRIAFNSLHIVEHNALDTSFWTALQLPGGFGCFLLVCSGSADTTSTCSYLYFIFIYLFRFSIAITKGLIYRSMTGTEFTV